MLAQAVEADDVVLETQLQGESGVCGVQDGQRGGDDLGADAVAREDEEFHHSTLPMARTARVMSAASLSQ